MSDSDGKPFEATPRRVLKARREGNAARSSEMPANLAFAAGALSITAIVPRLGALGSKALHEAVAGEPVAASLLIVGIALLPVTAAAVAGVVANVAQSGGLVFLAVTPKFERLNALEGVKRILSRETLAHSVRASCAFFCASAAMLPFVALSASASLQASDWREVAAATWSATCNIAFAACAVGLCFAVAEYGAARRAWLQKLRMSFEERKREAREEEGDAAARGRRRALHRSLLRSGMRRLKDAACVVTNPQHIAVALEYRPPRISVPRVLLRAADAAAWHARAVAARYDIAIVENPALARALYRDARVGEAIPQAHYVAVAEVVAALSRAGRADL